MKMKYDTLADRTHITGGPQEARRTRVRDLSCRQYNQKITKHSLSLVQKVSFE